MEIGIVHLVTWAWAGIFFYMACKEDEKTGFIDDKHALAISLTAIPLWVLLGFQDGIIAVLSALGTVALAGSMFFVLAYFKQIGEGDALIMAALQLLAPYSFGRWPWVTIAFSAAVLLGWLSREKEKYRLGPYLFKGTAIVVTALITIQLLDLII